MESKHIKNLRSSEYTKISGKARNFAFLLFEGYGHYLNKPLRNLSTEDRQYLRDTNSERIFLEEAKRDGPSPYKVPKEVGRKAYRFYNKYSKLDRAQLLKGLLGVVDVDLMNRHTAEIADQRMCIRAIYYIASDKRTSLTEEAYQTLASVTCDSGNFAGCCGNCDKCPLAIVTKASLDLKEGEEDIYYKQVFNIAYLLSKGRQPKLEGLSSATEVLLKLDELTLKGGDKNE